MIITFKSVKVAGFLAILLLSSCVTQNSKVACPSFDHHKHLTVKIFNKGKNISRALEGLSLKSTKKSDRGRKSYLRKPEKLNTSSEKSISKPIVSDDIEMPLVLSTHTGSNESDFKRPSTHALHTNSGTSVREKKNPLRNLTKLKRQIAAKKIDPGTAQKRSRKESIVKGGSLMLMAALAFTFFPVLGTVPASIALVAIFLLDLLISFLIYKYYKKRKPKLATITSGLRLLYSTLFGIGIGYHVAGSVLMFNTFWKIGLIGFGLHLIALGILFNNEGGKKWVNIAIKSLLIAAGIGYMIINIGILFAPNPIAFAASMQYIFLLPMILGELSFAVWMIFKGGKKNKE